MKVKKQDRAFFWATTFLRELHACGVSQLVISPGSRSTPLTVAASAHPGLTTHVVLDERSAAFMALGMGKSQGKPAGLICTSGTAAANYYPAIIEARHSGVPLLVLTADRPPHLRNIGASQSIDQVKLFGDYPVFFHEAGEPVLEQQDMSRLKSVAAQSVSTSLNRKGPAHINFPFRKPLEPDPGFVEQIRKENDKQALEKPEPRTTVSVSENNISLPDKIKVLLSKCRRPVVIDGPRGVLRESSAAALLADLLNAPLLSEFPNLSSKKRILGFDGFLKNEAIRKKLIPDLILRFGQQPVSKALHFYLQELDEIPHIHFGDLDEWQDATHSVTHRVEWHGRKILWQLDNVRTNPEWVEKWQHVDEQFGRFKDHKAADEQTLTDGAVFMHFGAQVPDFWNVFLSNSFPVRDWMLFAGSPARPSFVNRGASGIDGIISTAIGATIASQKPGILFIGDLATLHDSNGLLSAKFLEHPLVIVLLNNGGGNIFRMLPIFEHEQLYTDFFETPQQVNFESLSHSHELDYTAVSTIKELKALNLATFSSAGIHLVECKTNAEASMALRHSLWNFSE